MIEQLITHLNHHVALSDEEADFVRANVPIVQAKKGSILLSEGCLLYTADAAEEMPCVDLGGRRAMRRP